MAEIIGRLHSTESFGAVDGPGIRYVAFLQGCPLRCLFCHNPDTWDAKGGKEITPSELVSDIIRYKSFISGGGVTLSGGEPLLQADFCEEVIKLCHKENLHTAIDTSGCIPLDISKNAINESDMLLLDIKDIISDDCEELTGMTNENALKTLHHCEEIGKDVWIRHVLLPHYTMKDDKLKMLAEFLGKYKCIKRVDLLPYHTMGLYKWETLGIDSKIKGIDPPSEEQIQHTKSIFREYGF